ncbi:MAG: DUF4956 domain-containing protein [Pseudomonadales bacterium]
MASTLGTFFIVRLLINTASVIVLVRFCYYPYSRHRAHAMSFVLFGTGVFIVTALLHSADISMGFAFGLFAVFSMLRYRTESITIKEMTYLFLVISIALLSGVGQMTWWELCLLNGLICLMAYFSETSAILPILHDREILYENVANIAPDNKQALIADLREKTGLDIQFVETLSVDYLRDTARLKIHFAPQADHE